MPSNDEGVKSMADTSTGFNTSSAPGSPTDSVPRRRSSLFSGLESLKRPTSNDDMVRRASMNDQRPKGGMFGELWNSWVRGPSLSK